MKDSNIHKGHRDRLRKSFLSGGLDHFPPHNVLELLLFYALPQGDTNELAHKLINHYGSLPLVFDAPYEDLVRFKGIGNVSATLIKLVPAVTSYYMAQKAIEGTKMNSIEEVSEYFISKFLNSVHEEFYLMCKSSTGKVLKCVKIMEGTVNAVPVVTRLILTEAINSNATSVIVAHNHPSGITLPSSNDTFLTKNLCRALAHADIILDDHIIVSGPDYLSLREAGLFEKFPDYNQKLL